MANFRATLYLRDSYARDSVRRFTVTGGDFASVRSAMITFVNEYQALTQAEVLRWTLAEEIAFTGTLTAGANLDTGLTITAAIGGGGSKKGTIKIPATKTAFINADGSLDLTHIDIQLFEAEFTTGLVLISDGEVVDDFLSGRLDR
jgi:hypothetical protein